MMFPNIPKGKPCDSLVTQNIRNVRQGKELNAPLAYLNRSCKFRKVWDIVNNIKGLKSQEYRQSDKYKAYHKAYQQSDKYKASQKKYLQSDKYKASQKKYRQSDKNKASQKAYYLRMKEARTK